MFPLLLTCIAERASPYGRTRKGIFRAPDRPVASLTVKSSPPLGAMLFAAGMKVRPWNVSMAYGEAAGAATATGIGVTPTKAATAAPPMSPSLSFPPFRARADIDKVALSRH